MMAKMMMAAKTEVAQLVKATMRASLDRICLIIEMWSDWDLAAIMGILSNLSIYHQDHQALIRRGVAAKYHALRH